MILTLTATRCNATNITPLGFAFGKSGITFTAHAHVYPDFSKAFPFTSLVGTLVEILKLGLVKAH